MLKLTRPQWMAVISAIVLIVLLLFLPRKTNTPAQARTASNESAFSFEKLYNDAFSQLSENNKRVVDNLKENILQAENDSARALFNDSLAGIWKTFNWPSISAHYYEQAASLKNSTESWFKAGDAYFASFRFVQDYKEHSINKAISCYKKILEKDSTNLSAKTSIGVCYIEGAAYLGKAPMEGIGILQQVLEKDPKNINALFNLGYFALQSAQYDKALERFQTILQIDSAYAEAHIYMADVYLSKNDTLATIAALKKYKDLSTDETIKEQIQNYITELTVNKH